MKKIIDKLHEKNYVEKEELLYLLDNLDDKYSNYLIEKSNDLRLKQYGNKIFLRGLVEFTNYCKRDCMYCGIRASNKNANRYRLSEKEIMDICDSGYKLGYRTFVLQGGEDSYYDDQKIISIIKNIKENFKDVALTLSIGEKSYDSYRKYYEAGVDRYLLRHETANKKLYQKFHPNSSFESRRQCLLDLKEIGYQVGTGFLVGLPGQQNKDYVEDIMFLKELEPDMVGIGPFISQKDTPLKDEKNGTVEKTIIMLSLTRLFFPKVLLPATTALGSIDDFGRELGIKAGANVCMPNLNPVEYREKYSLYDGKMCIDDDAKKCRGCIEQKIKNIGFEIDMARGDSLSWRDRSVHK